MLGSIIKNTAIFIGVIVVAIVLLRDNTNFFASGPMAGQSSPPAHGIVQTDNSRRMAEEEPPQNEEQTPEEEEPEARVAKEKDREPEPRRNAAREQSTPDEMVVQAGHGGHFYVKADIDGNDVGFMVDTGASMVALSRADAENLGYSARDLNYTGRANTANGVARFAPVVLSQISIGDITIHDVQAVVMESPMNMSLLGMTFLRRLEGFEIKDDQLIMRW